MACIALPVASWLDGTPVFAWAMFSRASEYRIELITFDADGRPRPANPTLLAEHAAPAAAAALAGSDHWRYGSATVTLRPHLSELCAYACDETRAGRVEITLRERTVGGKERATALARRCSSR